MKDNIYIIDVATYYKFTFTKSEIEKYFSNHNNKIIKYCGFHLPKIREKIVFQYNDNTYFSSVFDIVHINEMGIVLIVVEF